MGRHFRNIYISTGVVALGAELVQLIRGKASPLQSLSLSNQPASKQMLINYISDFGTLRNVHHDDFYAGLRTLGYPQGTTGHPFRMVAISNGSECANSQGFEPGASLLSIDGKIQTRFLGDVAFSVLSYYAAPFFPLSNIFKLGILPGKNEFNATINLHSIGNGGGNQVYYCDINYKKKLYYLININVTLAHKEKDADNGMLPIDGYPGGFLFPTRGLQSASLTNWFIKYNLNVSVNRAFNFIPTTSSLDIGGGATALGSSDFLRVYSASTPPASPKQTPFANFIVARQNNVASVNEDHISFNARNADWAGNEITTNLAGTSPPLVDCSYICSGVLQIQGSTQICSTPETYTIPNLPTGATVTWSIIPSSGVASLSTSGNTATLSKTDNGSLQLSSTVHSACGDIILPIKELYVGLPPSPGSTSPSLNPMCPGQVKVVSLLPRAGIDSYYWYTNDTGITVSGNSIYGNIEANDPGTYQLKIRTTNSCGSTEQSYFVNVSDYGDTRCSGTAYRYSIYPNPAGNQVTVAYVKNGEELEIQKFKKEFSMKLYNDKGKEVSSANNNSEENSYSLDTSKLPDGNYFLHITDDKETIKKQIIIKH
jgi:hypothetical protein